MKGENPLNEILDADSIAFYGASNSPATMGTTQCLHLIRGKYGGKVWPIHPTEESVLGVKAYRSIDEVPEIPGLAVMVLPTKIVPEKMLECGRKGVRRAIIISGGFKERGEDGRALEERIKNIAREFGMRFVGPNCIGVINAKKNFNVTFFPYQLGSGPMGLVSQSGTYVTQTLFHLGKMGVRYSKAMSLGNEADIDLVDGLDYLGDDPDTKAIAVYIEGIRRGRKFMEVARRVSLKKPIVAYYVGGTEAGAKSGMSHTGAMGGSDAIHDAVFKQCGIVRAPTIEALYDWAWAFATQPLPKGRRIAIVSHSGGPVTSMADSSARAGFEIPPFSESTRSKLRKFVPHTGSLDNPVDLTFNLMPDAMTNTIPNIVYDSGEVDAVLVHGIMISGFLSAFAQEAPDIKFFPKAEMVSMKSIAESFHKGLVSLSHQKGCTVLTSSFGGREDEAVDYVLSNDIPVYPSPERAVYALRAMIQYSEWRARNK
jgi:acyl-CoA synthetase (NDP forming)